MRLKKNIATSEAGLIFNPGTGDSFSINPMGIEILSGLRQKMSEQQIIDLICSRYDTDRIQVEKDLEDFISQLFDYNLLEK